MSVCQVCATCAEVSRRTEEGVESLGATVIGSSEPPDIGAGNRTQDTWKNKQCSPPLSHLFTPSFYS